MDNPFRPSNKGAVRHPWSLSPKKKRFSKFDENGYPIPLVSPPDPSYYQMTGPYHQESSSQPDVSQTSQAHQHNPQNAVAGPSAPAYQPNMGFGVSSYRPTDPKSFPQYITSGPLAAYRPAEPKLQYIQHPVPGLFVPAQPPTTKAAEPEPRFIRAAQTGPGQYVPAAQGQGFAGGLGPVIQDKQEEDNPFTTSGRSGSTDRDPPRDTDSFDRRFLKSLIDSHEEDCSDSDSDSDSDSGSGSDSGSEPGEKAGKARKARKAERFCKRNRSLSPSVLKKNRVDDKLAKRVKELEGQIAQMKEEHEREVADAKSRAVKVVGDAVHEICGIERGTLVWGLVVSEAKKKLDEVPAVENEGEAL